MKSKNRQLLSCCNGAASLGGLSASDFSSLDALAVKLISLDGAFAEPLRAIGRVMGERIAGETDEKPIAFETALSALVEACGLDGAIESRFLRRGADEAVLEIAGCSEALGYPVENVGRAVCGFDAGLFEGFLRTVTDEADLSVDEIACLGLGHPACDFVIRKGVQNACC